MINKRYLVLAGDDGPCPCDLGWACYKGTFDTVDECKNFHPKSTSYPDHFCSWMEVIDMESMTAIEDWRRCSLRPDGSDIDDISEWEWTTLAEWGRRVQVHFANKRAEQTS